MEVTGPNLLISPPFGVRLDGTPYFFVVREVESTVDLIFSDLEMVTEAGFDFGLLLSPVVTECRMGSLCIWRTMALANH